MPVYQERKAGIYPSKYLGCDERTVTDNETGEEVVRWLWRFQELSDQTSAGEISKWTGTSMRSANSNAYKIASGILGHKPEPGDDTEKHVGQTFNVVYDRNQAGNLTITNILPYATASAEAVNNAEGTAHAATEHAAQEDELPF